MDISSGTCASCGYAIASTEIFCGICGTQKEIRPAQQRVPGNEGIQNPIDSRVFHDGNSESASGMIICPQCHRSSVLQGRFCIYCAYDFVALIQSAVAPINATHEERQEARNGATSQRESEPVGQTQQQRSLPVETASLGASVADTVPSSKVCVAESALPSIAAGYQDVFARFDAVEGKFLLTWNWSAFAGGPFWFIAKHMNKQAACLLGIIILAVVLGGWIGLIVVALLTGIDGNWRFYKYCRAVAVATERPA